MPSSWDELAEHILLGFVVNTFTWEQAVECLTNPEWSYIHLITAIMVGMELVGLYWGVYRDRRELRLVEAIMAGRRRDQMHKRRKRHFRNRTTTHARDSTAGRSVAGVKNQVMRRRVADSEAKSGSTHVPVPSGLLAPAHMCMHMSKAEELGGKGRSDKETPPSAAPSGAAAAPSPKKPMSVDQKLRMRRDPTAVTAAAAAEADAVAADPQRLSSRRRSHRSSQGLESAAQSDKERPRRQSYGGVCASDKTLRGLSPTAESMSKSMSMGAKKPQQREAAGGSGVTPPASTTTTTTASATTTTKELHTTTTTTTITSTTTTSTTATATATIAATPPPSPPSSPPSYERLRSAPRLLPSPPPSPPAAAPAGAGAPAASQGRGAPPWRRSSSSAEDTAALAAQRVSVASKHGAEEGERGPNRHHETRRERLERRRTELAAGEEDEHGVKERPGRAVYTEERRSQVLARTLSLALAVPPRTSRAPLSSVGALALLRCLCIPCAGGHHDSAA